MSDRLDELVRQRALVQEHLTWLNREIAAAAEAAKSATAGGPTPPVPGATFGSPPPASVPSPPVSAALPPSRAAAVDADEIIARFQMKPDNVRQDVRKGCLLYFAGAFVLLGLVVAVLYFVLGQAH